MCKQVDNTTPQTGRERLDTSELEIIELRALRRHRLSKEVKTKVSFPPRSADVADRTETHALMKCGHAEIMCMCMC